MMELTVSMDIHTDSHSVNRLEVVNTGRRRRWTISEKLRIVEESFSGLGLASATARRHGISNQLLFAWRKAYREGRLGDDPVPDFVPAVIVPEPSARNTNADCRRLEIVSPQGWRVLVNRDVDEDALARVLRALEGLA
jgi:transposase